MSCVVLFVTWFAVSAEWTYAAMVIVGFALLTLLVPVSPRRRRRPAPRTPVPKSRRVA